MVKHKPTPLERLRVRVRDLKHYPKTWGFDYEHMHSEEDSIREEALKLIRKARTLKEAKDLAAEALKTSKFKFPRYCA